MLHHKFPRAFKFHLHSALQLLHLWCCTLNLLISQKILNSSVQHNAIPGAMLWVLLRFSRQSRTQGSNLPEAVVFFTWLTDFDWLTDWQAEWFETSFRDSISSPFQRYQLLLSCQKDQVSLFQLSAYLLFPRIFPFLWFSVLSHRSNSLNLDIILYCTDSPNYFLH